MSTAAERSGELLSDLLYEMAKALNYDFDKVHLKRGAYMPQLHAEIELEQSFIRRSLTDLFLGRKSIPINIVNSGEHSEVTQTEKGNKEKHNNSIQRWR